MVNTIKQKKKIKLEDYLKEYLSTQNMSVRAFAKKIGLSRSYTHYLVNGERGNAGISVLKKIAKATDITINELLEILVFEDDDVELEKETLANNIKKIIDHIENNDDLEKILAYVELFENSIIKDSYNEKRSH